MPAHRLETRRVAGSGGGRHQRAEVAPQPDVRPTARRVPGHTPWANGNPTAADSPMRASSPHPSMNHERPDRLRSPRRVGVDRQSRRSLALGGALVIAILGGAGAVAWAAKPPASAPAVSVDAGNGTDRDDTSTAPVDGESLAGDPAPSAGPVAGSAAGNPIDGSADPARAATSGAESPAAASAPTGFGPATVSPLGPGDAGFGWPSTAFGTAAAGAGR